mmetsp:Transcript_78963/g.128015  ORF Transcript_78963/g.128015 Transcript_78963/m.128015 type:complete len:106 (+) Transcript_78963:776-1093(+)
MGNLMGARRQGAPSCRVPPGPDETKGSFRVFFRIEMSQSDWSECDQVYKVFQTRQNVLIGTSQSEKKAQASQFKTTPEKIDRKNRIRTFKFDQKSRQKQIGLSRT